MLSYQMSYNVRYTIFAQWEIMFENCKSYDANNTWESVKYSGTLRLFNRAYNHELIPE